MFLSQSRWHHGCAITGGDMEPTRRLLIGGLATVGMGGIAWKGGAMSQDVPTPPRPNPEAMAQAMRDRAMALLRYEKITVPGAKALAE